jgi:hypothetical protein
VTAYRDRLNAGHYSPKAAADQKAKDTMTPAKQDAKAKAKATTKPDDDDDGA